jgi:hypothetical protein
MTLVRRPRRGSSDTHTQFDYFAWKMSGHAQKELAFSSKQSVYVDVRGVEIDCRTPFAPSIASIRGLSW